MAGLSSLAYVARLMTFQISSYSITFLVTVIILVIAESLTWWKRHAPGGIFLFLMILAVIEWNLTGFMEASSLQLTDKILWSKWGYLGVHLTPGLFLLFSLAYTGQKRWLTRRNILLLFLVPVITIVLAATNEWHHLIWTGFTPGPTGTNSYIYSHGIWFWVATIYINSLLFLGTLFMLRYALRSKEIYLYQTIAIVIAILPPWISFLIYLSSSNPFPGLDFTAVAFGFTGSILVFIILHWRFLDIIPVAREILVEEMVDGVLVLDEKNRIIDINMTAKRLFGFEASHPIGKRIDAVLADWPDITNHLDNYSNSENVITIHSPQIHHIDIRVSPLQKRGSNLPGRLIVVRDVTKGKQAEEALRQANQALQEKLAEIEKLQHQLREQSIHDPLTNLFNRRLLEETLEKEFARAQRGNYSVIVMIIDVDHFKQLNDTHGHKAGDQVLIALANFLLSAVRQGDSIYRYGGDEFLIITAGIRPEEIQNRAESLCLGFKALPIEYEEIDLRTTISIGVACYPQHARKVHEIIQAADAAMYAAKRAGGNRVHVWETTQ
jgi:diguanylate cyclase (GGDEF)-like protein/PAS domain S-box-containing protein